MKLFFHQKKIHLLWATLWTLLYLTVNYSLAYFILHGLNCYSLSLGKVFMVQIVVYFILYFSPTPGGSGIAEGTFCLLFAPLLPKHILGLFLLLWRFFTTYLGVAIGGVIIIKTLGLKEVEVLAAEEVKPHLEENDSSAKEVNVDQK